MGMKTIHKSFEESIDRPHKKATVEGTKETKTGMEVEMEEVWKQLPDELLLKLVNDHLPLQSQCRSRSVSKAWKSPRLRPGAFRGLYLRKDKEHRGLSLYDDKAGKYHTLLPKGPLRHKFGNCVNGLLAAVFATAADNFRLRDQVLYAVFNVFKPGWTQLPCPPPAPGRGCLFAALSKKVGEPPRIGQSNLEDYIFMVAMGNHITYEVPATSLVLQVYNAGQWSCSLVNLPPGHLFMYGSAALHFKSGIFRGSEYLFLTMHSNNTAVSLCCIDVLAEHMSCKVLCGLDPKFVAEWRFSTTNHPKLALCSGKVLLVHRQDLPGEDHIVGVQELDEEKLQWRLISSLKVEEVCPRKFCPQIITFGGDELVIYYGNGKGCIYNAVTGAWSTTQDILFPISYQP